MRHHHRLPERVETGGLRLERRGLREWRLLEPGLLRLRERCRLPKSGLLRLDEHILLRLLLWRRLGLHEPGLLRHHLHVWLLERLLIRKSGRLGLHRIEPGRLRKHGLSERIGHRLLRLSVWVGHVHLTHPHEAVDG